MIGTTRYRELALWAGLALLASVNYLDMTGVLALDVSNGLLSLLTAAWVAVVAVTGLEAVGRWFRHSLAIGGLHVVGVIALGALYRDVGTYYAIHATVLGQLLFAIAPVAWTAAGELGVIAALEWVDDYRSLRATSPEERVLK